MICSLKSTTEEKREKKILYKYHFCSILCKSILLVSVSFETGSHCLAQAGFRILILLLHLTHVQLLCNFFFSSVLGIEPMPHAN